VDGLVRFADFVAAAEHGGDVRRLLVDQVTML
jgi:hypothetical protein